MTFALPPAMAEALRRTRAGDLAGATDLIKAALAGAPVAPDRVDPIDLLPDRARIAGGTPTTTTARPRSFAAQDYRGPEGTLRYWLYRPADARPGMPLLVMLHGCTQSPEDFARGTRMNALADEQGFLVVYPAQTSAANAQKCWNWFRPGDQRRDAGEPALIAAVTRLVLAEQRCDPARVYIAGLSAGGAAAAIMGAAYPDLYAAIGIHSGLARGAARDLSSALGAMTRGGRGTARTGDRPVPVITFHGDRDSTVDKANSVEIGAAATLLAGIPLEASSESGIAGGGRRYTRAINADARGRPWIEQWTVHGAGHAWSGGDAAGSYTDPAGPDASRAMLDFFRAQPGA